LDALGREHAPGVIFRNPGSGMEDRVALFKRISVFIFVMIVVSAAAAASKPAPAAVGKTLSQRVVAYNIQARLNPQKKTIEAVETLTYKNLTGRPLQEFPFHLYLNAFQPKSTFMRETRRDEPTYKWDDKNFGAIEVKSLNAVGIGDLTSQIKFVHPDDDNADDRTVMMVQLPKPVPPGGEIQFKIAFHDQLPEVLARTGYKRDFFMVGQWFPKVGVFWNGAWNCHQFHETTEFFADFGVYDVAVTVPKNYVLGASGDLVSTQENADGTKTVAFHGEDIHDFAWTADPHYRVVEDSWSGSGGTVKIRLLMSPEHYDQAGRHLQALKGTLAYFDKNFGPYPYDRITVIDPPHGAGRAGGMEYPTLITAGTTWWMPMGLRIPEDVVEHEFGHQYWYGMVANNEFEDAWLDEGINSYAELKTLNALYGFDTSLANFLGATVGENGYQRTSYISNPDTDPLARNGWQYLNRGTYGAMSYGKTATVLFTLEGILGADTMQRVMNTYFTRYRFTHPTKEDFLKTVEDVSGKNLRWYFNQAVYGTQVLDYEVLSLNSDRVDWYNKQAVPEKNGQTVYRSNVVLHRKGDFIFPADVAIKFDNGEVVREHWDGQDRWVRYTYEKKAKLVSAEIDPDHKVWLDRNFFNNSKMVQPDTRAKRKLATYWLLMVQFMSHMAAWLA
jgi:hypothetical protein